MPRHGESLLVTGHPLAHHQEALGVRQPGGPGRVIVSPCSVNLGAAGTAPVLQRDGWGPSLAHQRWGPPARLPVPPWGSGSGECDQWGLVAGREAGEPRRPLKVTGGGGDRVATPRFVGAARSEDYGLLKVPIGSPGGNMRLFGRWFRPFVRHLRAPDPPPGSRRVDPGTTSAPRSARSRRPCAGPPRRRRSPARRPTRGRAGR